MAGTLKGRGRAGRLTCAPPAARGSRVAGDIDAQLMLQVAAGDRAAATTLIDRNRGRVASYITRLVHDARAAEDLTQDVFLLVLKYADEYRPTSKFATWLYRVATNVALNYLKCPATRRKSPRPPEDRRDLEDRRLSRPEQEVARRELRDQVLQVLGSLPLNQRVALTLREYEGCSYAQVATILETSVEGVRGLLRRARTYLRRHLDSLA